MCCICCGPCFKVETRSTFHPRFSRNTSSSMTAVRPTGADLHLRQHARSPSHTMAQTEQTNPSCGFEAGFNTAGQTTFRRSTKECLRYAAVCPPLHVEAVSNHTSLLALNRRYHRQLGQSSVSWRSPDQRCGEPEACIKTWDKASVVLLWTTSSPRPGLHSVTCDEDGSSCPWSGSHHYAVSAWCFGSLLGLRADWALLLERRAV